MNKDNKFAYKTKFGKVKGYFKIYQAVNGSIQLMMGNYNTTLTKEQILELNIDTLELEDYDHNKFCKYYFEEK